MECRKLYFLEHEGNSRKRPATDDNADAGTSTSGYTCIKKSASAATSDPVAEQSNMPELDPVVQVNLAERSRKIQLLPDLCTQRYPCVLLKRFSAHTTQ